MDNQVLVRSRKYERERAVSQAIRKALTLEVKKYLWGRLRYYGFTRTVDYDELTQYIQIAAWKALLSDPQLMEREEVYAYKILNKLLDLLRNVGRDQLGLGLRKQNSQFTVKVVRGLDLASIQVKSESPCSEPIERLARDTARSEMITRLKDLAPPGSTLYRKLHRSKEKGLFTVVSRAPKDTLIAMIRNAADELDSSIEGVRLFQEACDQYKISTLKPVSLNQ
jgi:hypothetical protein